MYKPDGSSAAAVQALEEQNHFLTVDTAGTIDVRRDLRCTPRNEEVDGVVEIDVTIKVEVREAVHAGNDDGLTAISELDAENELIRARVRRLAHASGFVLEDDPADGLQPALMGGTSAPLAGEKVRKKFGV